MTDAEDAADAPAGLVPVGEWRSFAEASEHALVVLAMNLECWIFPGHGTYAVFAEAAHAGAIRREYRLYEAEQAERREIADSPLFPAGAGLFCTWALLLLAVFYRQGRDGFFTDRFCNSSTAMVEGGEWWRPFTSLFLHADVSHLLGNVAIGGIFCVMAAKLLGALRAWPLILLAGTLANALNAGLRYPGSFESIGASTATFAALGILAGASSRSAWRHRSYREFRPLLAPLLAGLMLLAWYGSGGENTDVAGHFLGWTCGALLGALALPRAAAGEK